MVSEMPRGSCRCVRYVDVRPIDSRCLDPTNFRKASYREGDLGHFLSYYSTIRYALPLRDLAGDWGRNEYHPVQPEYYLFPPSYMTLNCCNPIATRRIVADGIRFAFWLTRFPGRKGDYIVTGYYDVDHGASENMRMRFGFCCGRKHWGVDNPCYSLVAKVRRRKASAHFVHPKEAFKIELDWWNKSMRDDTMKELTTYSKRYFAKPIANTRVAKEVLSHLNQFDNALPEYVRMERKLVSSNTSDD